MSAEDEWIARYKQQMSAHVLDVVASGPVTCVRMRKPGTRIELVQLTFTPEGIAIQGDMCPELNGVCSCYGYGLGWFVRQLSVRYLAEKFLRRQWVEETAREHVERLLEDWRADEETDPTLIDDLAEAHEDMGSDWSEHSYRDTIVEVLERHHIYEVEDVWPDHDYNRRDLFLLAAIQQRFRELFWQRYELRQDGGHVVMAEKAAT